MIEIEVLNVREVERQLFGMREKVPSTIRMAVNETARKARQRLAKKAQETYTIKSGGFNKAMRIKNANNATLTAEIKARGEKIPAGKFSTRAGTLGPETYYNPVTHRQQVGKGGRSASVRLLRSGTFKSRDADRKWFKTKFGSGHMGIFHRAGRERLPLKETFGLSIPQMIGSEKQVYGIVEPFIQDDLQAALDRHIARAIRGDF